MLKIQSNCVFELPPGLLSTTTPVARIGRAAWAGGTLVADVPGDIALVIEEMAPRVRARSGN